jgi:hypothetical protein
MMAGGGSGDVLWFLHPVGRQNTLRATMTVMLDVTTVCVSAVTMVEALMLAVKIDMAAMVVLVVHSKNLRGCNHRDLKNWK